MCVRIKDSVYLGKDGIKFSPRRTWASKACEGGLGQGRLRFWASPEEKTERQFSGCQSEDSRGPCWVAPPWRQSWRQCFPGQSSHVLTSLGTASLHVEPVSTSTSYPCQKHVIHQDPRGKEILRKFPTNTRFVQTSQSLLPAPTPITHTPIIFCHE